MLLVLDDFLKEALSRIMHHPVKPCCVELLFKWWTDSSWWQGP
jgi:hypothetical protein